MPRGSSTSSAGCVTTSRPRGATVEAEAADMRDVQVSLTAELARAYFELRGAQEQLDVARAQRRESAPLARGDAAAAGRGSGHGIRHRAGAGAAQPHARLHSPLEARSPSAISDRRAGGRPPAAVAAELQAAGALPALPDHVQVAQSRLGGARPARRGRRRAPARRRARAGGRGQGRLPAAVLPRRKCRIYRDHVRLAGRPRDVPLRGGPSFSWPAFNLGRIKTRVDARERAERRSRGAVQPDGAAGVAGCRDVALPLPHRTRAGRADQGRRHRQRARRGAGAAAVHRRGGRLPPGARRRADPARCPRSVGAGTDRRGHRLRRAVQGAGRQSAGRGRLQ